MRIHLIQCDKKEDSTYFVDEKPTRPVIRGNIVTEKWHFYDRFAGHVMRISTKAFNYKYIVNEVF
jgi:hypothetical protein